MNKAYITEGEQKDLEPEGARAYRDGNPDNPYQERAGLTGRNYELFTAWDVGYRVEEEYWIRQ